MLGASSVQAWTLCVGVLAALASLLSAIELMNRFAFSRAAQLMDYNETCRHVESINQSINFTSVFPARLGGLDGTNDCLQSGKTSV